MAAKPHYLGIDCGGTLCRAALCIGDRRIEAERPGANATSDFEGMVASIVGALEIVADGIGVPLEEFAEVPAYLGVAGIVGPGMAGRLADALPLRNAMVEEDRRAALVGALGYRDGCIALCGTGSFLGLQTAGRAVFAGGHGLVLGDQASGAWIGRGALSATLDAADGLGPTTGLTTTLQHELGGKDGIIAFAGTAQPAAFARLAPRVVETAKTGDPVAQALLGQGASYLSDGLAALGWRGDMPVCLMGGLGPAYGPYLPAHMQAVLTAPAGTALDGALSLAARMAARDGKRTGT